MSTTSDTSSSMESDTVGVRPFTGEEYLESLRDGREIWIYGERVKDVTTHPAFRNTARMIARLYDALHDPALQDVLTTETDTGSGSRTHKYFKAPKSGEEQLLPALRSECTGLVQKSAGAGDVSQPRYHPPTC